MWEKPQLENCGEKEMKEITGAKERRQSFFPPCR